jgi:hypothetical protein
VGVDADALPTSEKLSPAAPSTFTAAALFVRFCFEACLTRDMAASSVSSCEIAWQACARQNRRARPFVKKCETSHRVSFIFMNVMTHSRLPYYIGAVAFTRSEWRLRLVRGRWDVETGARRAPTTDYMSVDRSVSADVRDATIRKGAAGARGNLRPLF